MRGEPTSGPASRRVTADPIGDDVAAPEPTVIVRMEEGDRHACPHVCRATVVAPEPMETSFGMTISEPVDQRPRDRRRSVSAAPPAVSLAGIRVSFPDDADGARGAPLVAIDDVSFGVEPHEVVALVGPNGCGKSTLLRVIGGLQRIDRGSATLDGRPIVGPDAAVGFVFQEPRLLPWRDTLDNIAYPLELAGIDPADRRGRARELLRVVGLERFAAYRPHQLSGGMRQRAAVARALALDPSILLLDEPFSALDALTRERFNVELLRLLHRTSTTIVLVTHDIREAVFLADRILVLSPRPARVLAEVRSPLSRPRSARDLDDPRLGEAAIAIREHLGYSGEEGDRPSELTTDRAFGAATAAWPPPATGRDGAP